MESTTSKLSTLAIESQDHWGPPHNFIFEQYKNLPFAPFSKLEKISKACDFTASGIAKQQAAGVSAGNIGKAEDEDDFILVETQASQKKTSQYKVRRPINTAYKPQQQSAYQKQRVQTRTNYPRNQAVKTKFKDNAGVQTDWIFIIDAGKSNFEKAPVGSVVVKDILQYGTLREFDKGIEKANPKKEIPLATTQGAFTLGYGLTDDQVLLDLIDQDTNIAEPTIYVTDSVLAAILTVKNSVFPWDVRVTKIGNQYMFEQSEKEKTSYIDMLTVNENTNGNLPEEEKDLIRLCVEATNINKNFINQTAKSNEKTWQNDKYDINEIPERRLYKYRKYTLDGKLNVIVRAEVDSYIKKPSVEGEPENLQYLKICALNEYDLSSDWRTQLDQARGAIISAEFRNNSCKLSKWLCQALLADVNTIQLGFVSRAAAKDYNKHVVLLVEQLSTTSLSQTIGYKLKDNWSVIKHLIETLSKQEDGTYALVKAPYKQALRIYRIPKEEESQA